MFVIALFLAHRFSTFEEFPEHPIHTNSDGTCMSIPRILEKLIGNWAGPSHLYLSWPPTDEATHKSHSTASITSVANGKFLLIAYTWVYKDKTQEGLILFGLDDRNNIKAAWIDSWHMGNIMMICEGTADAAKVTMTGSYAAPPGPDWRWRTEIQPVNDNTFRMVMYNISPEGEESLAVEAEYSRQTTS